VAAPLAASRMAPLAASRMKPTGSTTAWKARMATSHFKAAAAKSTAFNMIGGDRGLQIEMS
jgi:hypothetical protein